VPEQPIAANKKALVLSGGGARGAYEAGVILGLAGRNEQFDIVCGTSIGAINASFVSQDRLGDLETVWKSIAQYGVISLTPEIGQLQLLYENIVGVLNGPAILERVQDAAHIVGELQKLGPLKDIEAILNALKADAVISILQKYLDFQRIVKTLIVSATNLTFSTSDAFYFFPPSEGAAQAEFIKQQQTDMYPILVENFADIVRASAAIPGAFPPVNITPQGGSASFYVDGGVANNTPIGVAIDAGATDITVVFLDPDTATTPQPMANLLDVGLSCFSVMQQRILESDLKTAASVNLQPVSSNHRQVGLTVVRPSKTLPVTVLEFNDQNPINTAFEMGLQDGKTGGTRIA
jgi:predicted acylesterase/phospholipase RssA